MLRGVEDRTTGRMISRQRRAADDCAILGRKGRDTRRKIVEAMVQLLATTSHRDIKVTDVARRINTSSSAFYIYFDSVTEAVLASVGQISQSTPAILDIANREWDERTAQGCALALVETHIGFWDENRALLRARTLAAEEGDMRFHEARRHSLRPLFEALVRQIERGQRYGRADPAIPAEATARALVAMLERVGAVTHADGGLEDEDQIVLRKAVAAIVAAAAGWPTIG